MKNDPVNVRGNQSGCTNQTNSGINITDSTPHASGNAANQAGSSFSPLPPATTYEEQLAKMEERGLVINDRNLALATLQDLNYYRLRGYWLTLEADGSFAEGTCFDDIWEIYQLDRELRKWLWEALTPIEIKLRTQFAYEFAHRCGADAYLDESNFHSASSFERALDNYKRECDRAYNQGVPYVVHNMDKYGKLPVWAAVEIMTFGTLSMFYGNLDYTAGKDINGNGVADAVASSFGIKYYYLKSWMHHLTTVRNIVAHHDRFYNQMMSIRPRLLKRDTRYSGNKQFPTLLIIERIYERSWPEEWNTLGTQLGACFERHPNVKTEPMEMPQNWKQILQIP